jgi:hypothetical protein
MAAFYHHGAVPWFVDRIMGYFALSDPLQKHNNERKPKGNL